LTTDLASATTYTLTVSVGLRNLESQSFGGVIELLAGSTVLESYNSGTVPTAGNWSVWTLTYDSGSSNPLAGQALGIELMSTTNQTAFDGVFLNDASDVPEPAMFALVGAGLLGLVTRRRFAK
jgi:hypothetical protein